MSHRRRGQPVELFATPPGWVPTLGVILFLWLTFPGFWFWLGIVACGLLVMAHL